MAQIKITKGLDIPIQGKPQGMPTPLVASGTASPAAFRQIALDLKPFDDIKFKLLVKPGDTVAIGQPIAEDKICPGRMFCSPGGGTVKEIRRGLKRSLQDIVIDLAAKEEYHRTEATTQMPRQQLIEALKAGGAFTHIRSRPFNLLANPEKTPRSIFVKALESAPFTPPAEMQVAGFETEFQAGLDALKKLTDGDVHLFYREGSDCHVFSHAKNVVVHTGEGPHPIGSHSLFIQAIDPIRSVDDAIWTLNVHDVLVIGRLVTMGRYFINRVVSVAGPGLQPDRTGYFFGREGMPVSSLVSGRLQHETMRLISGNPLTGSKVDIDGFLGFNNFELCAIPENREREFLHFFRLGKDKYSFSKAYLSGHRNNSKREYPFTTNQHGEHRAFIDSTLYDEVMPLPIPTMLLVKAVMAEDFDLAEELGLLGVDSDDFALATFVCPSKMEMTEIIKQGLRRHAQDSL